MAAPTFIAYNSTAIKIGDDLFVTLTDVEPGDLIIAFSGGFPGNDGTGITIQDTAGNTWLGGYGCAHFYGTKVWFAVANGSGATTIKVTCATGAATRAAALNYRDHIRPWAEVVFPLGYYVPVDAANYPQGIGTAEFNLADSFIVTVMCTEARSGTTGLVASDTGDTCRNLGSPSDNVMWAFDRTQTASSNVTGESAIVQLKGGAAAFSEFPMITLVFSSPLDETDPGRDRQYQTKAGCGFDRYNPAAFALVGPENLPATNRPLTLSLPSRPIVDPALGKMAMLTVGVMSMNEIDVNSLSVQDEYTNAYDLLIYSPGYAGQVHVAIFRTVISDPSRMPGVGSVFQISLNLNPQGITDAPYQHCAIGVAERTVYTLPGTPATAGFKQVDDHNPSFRLISDAIVAVPKDAYIFFFAGFNSGLSQDSVIWGFRDGYTGTSSGRIQFPSVQANAPRLGPCVVGDKIAPAAGTYDAQVDGEIGGVFSVGGGIAMVAVSFPSLLQLIKHVSGGAGVPTDWTLSAVGPDTISGAGGAGPTEVTAGTYALSETGGLPNYTPSAWSCTGGSLTGATLLLGSGQSVVCSITNTFAGSGPPPPEFCIITPISTPPPSFVVYPEPEELKGS